MHLRSFWSFWRHGFTKAVKKSFEKYGWAILLCGLFYTIGAFFISSRIREEKFWGFDMNYWVTFGIPAVLLLLFLGYHLFKAPYEIYKELHKKASEEVASRDSAIEKLTAEIEAIKTSKPILELFAPLPDQDCHGETFGCIAVRNKSTTGTARMVKVELLEIEPAPELRALKTLLDDVPYPIKLQCAESEGETIHPGCFSKFYVFAVHRQTIRSEIGVPFISLSFVGRPRFFDEHPDAPKFNIGGFCPLLKDKKNSNLGYKDYSIKIRVSAEGFPAMDKKFAVFFVCDMSQYAIQIA